VFGRVGFGKHRDVRKRVGFDTTRNLARVGSVVLATLAIGGATTVGTATAGAEAVFQANVIPRTAAFDIPNPDTDVDVTSVTHQPPDELRVRRCDRAAGSQR
jgi:hypothetical protein